MFSVIGSVFDCIENTVNRSSNIIAGASGILAVAEKSIKAVNVIIDNYIDELNDEPKVKIIDTPKN